MNHLLLHFDMKARDAQMQQAWHCLLAVPWSYFSSSSYHAHEKRALQARRMKVKTVKKLILKNLAKVRDDHNCFDFFFGHVPPLQSSVASNVQVSMPAHGCIESQKIHHIAVDLQKTDPLRLKVVRSLNPT